MTEYKTSDLYFSAYLMTAGCVLKNTEKAGRRVVFVFDYQPLLDDLKLQWHNNVAMVKAQPFASQIKNLKSLVISVLS